jgi:hypothetical protein
MGPFINIDRDIMGLFISISSTCHRSVMGPFIIIDPFRLMGLHGHSHTLSKIAMGFPMHIKHILLHGLGGEGMGEGMGVRVWG